mmetsp:Transcript_14766/g.27699  ORF Transcript_14766/g.27699 Transcript_14766/m.27699 type:complete len:485 (-) Transcript_14766:665-2119(-)
MISFRQNYKGGTEVPLEHALLGLDCPAPHVQALSLMLVLCHMKFDTPLSTAPKSNTLVKPQEDNGKATTNNKQKEKEKGKLKDKVRKVRNALKIQDTVKKKQRRPHVLVCEKLHQSGHIRKVYWCLLNNNYDSRKLAVEVLTTCEEILNEEKNSQQNVWQYHTLEQGVVPLLELVACGYPIVNTSPIPSNKQTLHFPEQHVCLFAQALLSRISTVLIDDSALQEKLVLSLTHTKNSVIRGNIFSGLVFLSSRNVSISKLLLRTSTSVESTKSIFAEILSEIYLEDSLHELKQILKIISHFFQNRHVRLEMMHEKSKQLDIQKKDSRVVKEKLSLTTEVFIRDKHNGSLVKMQCPDKNTLKEHSNRLALLMETEASKPNPTSKDGNCPTLPGYYHIWQEIFSHMIDDYVMDTSLAATGVVEILELYVYSCRYELTHLCMRYTKELINRLSTESFLQVSVVANARVMTYHKFLYCREMRLYCIKNL